MPSFGQARHHFFLRFSKLWYSRYEHNTGSAVPLHMCGLRASKWWRAQAEHLDFHNPEIGWKHRSTRLEKTCLANLSGWMPAVKEILLMYHLGHRENQAFFLGDRDILCFFSGESEWSHLVCLEAAANFCWVALDYFWVNLRKKYMLSNIKRRVSAVIFNFSWHGDNIQAAKRIWRDNRYHCVDVVMVILWCRIAILA